MRISLPRKSNGIVDGKAKLLHEDYCDGLGDCLLVCSVEAITFEERKAAEYDRVAVTSSVKTRLSQWPVQIKLVSLSATYFKNAHLLVAADCTAYAYASFHAGYMKDRVTIIGCPKLDDVDYSTKLTAILETNDIKSVTVVRMEVPCCSRIENAVLTAMKNSGNQIPCQVITISTECMIYPFEEHQYL